MLERVPALQLTTEGILKSAAPVEEEEAIGLLKNKSTLLKQANDLQRSVLGHTVADHFSANKSTAQFISRLSGKLGE